jgi:hypothetical protein
MSGPGHEEKDHHKESEDNDAGGHEDRLKPQPGSH